MVLTFLISLVAVLGGARAQVPNTIFVRSDGSVEPATAPIQKSGNVYTLTDNIIWSTIVVQKSDIIIDGAGFKLQGQQAKDSIGIDISNIHNITIQDFTIADFQVCVNLKNTYNSKITQNNITISSGYGDGVDVVGSSDDVISKNNIISSKLFVMYNGIWLRDCFNEEVSENNLNGSERGIFLTTTSNSTISANSMTQNDVGIQLTPACNNNQIAGNTVFASVVYGAHPNQNAGTGIKLIGALYNNQVHDNNISYNGNGMVLWLDTRGTVIYGNYFQNNSNHVSLAFESGASNSWDNGSVGNYWDNYLFRYPNATEIDNSGIGNTPYVIDENNTDHYPLMYNPNHSLLSTPSPTPVSTTSEMPIPTIIVITTVAVAVLVVFILSILLYRRPRKTKHS